MYFNLYVSAGIWGIVLVTLLLLAAHGGMYAYDYWYKKKKFSHNNEMAGIVFSVLSLIYSLIVAFVIVAVWENYEDLNKTIEQEADGLNNVLAHSSILPDSLRLPVEDAIKNYCLKVVNDEWTMSENQERYKGKIIPPLRMLLFKAKAENKIHQSLLSLLDDNLSNVTNLHRERLSHTRAYVPELIWMILIIGSLMVICFSFFLKMESLQLRRIFLSFLWGMIGMSLFLIYMLDHPFIGSTQVSRAPYEAILSQLSGN
jgi:hypothetical protein